MFKSSITDRPDELEILPSMMAWASTAVSVQCHILLTNHHSRFMLSWSKLMVEAMGSLVKSLKVCFGGTLSCLRHSDQGSQSPTTNLRTSSTWKLHIYAFWYRFRFLSFYSRNSLPLATHNMSTEEIINGVDWDSLV